MWDWAIWGALIFAGLAGSAALALLGVRARTTWRDLKDVRRGVVSGLAGLEAKGEATADKVAATGDTAELQESLRRLRRSLAQLAVLRAALEEVQVTFGWVTAVASRK